MPTEKRNKSAGAGATGSSQFCRLICSQCLLRSQFGFTPSTASDTFPAFHQAGRLDFANRLLLSARVAAARIPPSKYLDGYVAGQTMQSLIAAKSLRSSDLSRPYPGAPGTRFPGANRRRRMSLHCQVDQRLTALIGVRTPYADAD